MSQFSAGEDNVCGYVTGVISEFHPDLLEAKIRIIRAMPMRGPRPIKVAKAGPSDLADGYDLVLLYDGVAFECLREGAALALVDHAISGWRGEQRKRRNGQVMWVYKKVSPVELYPEVVLRHEGALPEWRHVAEQFKQMTLDFTSDDEKSNIFSLR